MKTSDRIKRNISKPEPKEKGAAEKKVINLALQGGGSHGAFTWGVLDRLLEEEKLHIEAFTGTSAGAVNAVVATYGLAIGNRESAKNLLHILWNKISKAAALSPVQPTIMDKFLGNNSLKYSPPFIALEMMTRLFSPYQLNVFNINPLREIVRELVDFSVLRKCGKIKLFVNATNVLSGKIKVFHLHELTLDMVMASACLPLIFKSVMVEGEPYWDGGYSGNPAIYPLVYNTDCNDVVLVQINPVHVQEVPTDATEILNRINEISFNATLMREMRAIAFVAKLIDDGKLEQEGYKKLNIHMIEAEEIMSSLSNSSKMNADWDFLCYLRDIGRQAAEDWLKKNFEHIGVKSSLDIRSYFL